MIELESELNATGEQLLFALRAGRFSDYSVPLGGAILRLMRRVAKENFDTEGGHARGGWPPLAPSTLAERARLGYGNLPMMQRTRRLYKSLAGGRSTADSIVEVTPTSLTWGTRTPYAIYHQSDAPRTRLPLRQVIPDPMPGYVEPELKQLLRDWIIEGRGA